MLGIRQRGRRHEPEAPDAAEELPERAPTMLEVGLP
jgi:hypothetical protein